MNILIDINHPAHVHYFRNVYKLLTDGGHKVYFVSRNKEIEHKLLTSYHIPFFNRGKGSNGKIAKFLYLLYADFKLYSIARKHKIDLFLNFLHPYPSQVAKLLRKTSLVFSDSEHAKLHHKLTMPFVTKVFTPACYKIDLGEKHIRFKGFMELAYLHPCRFKPDPFVLNWLGLAESEKFVIIRFVSWKAVHDHGHSGMTMENKRKAVQELSKHARVYISSEAELPSDLETFRIKIPFNKIHDALYYSSLLLGESATMASEAAVLGTPAIFINSIQLGYLEQQENQYGLVYNFNDTEKEQEMAISKAIEILQDPGSKEKYRTRRAKLLNECIDTTQFMFSEVLKHDPALIHRHSHNL
jgi:predicted glycosyltransferase